MSTWTLPLLLLPMVCAAQGPPATTQFALAMHRQLARGTEGNIFFSPLGLRMAMAMAYGGASGTTRDQLASAFHFPTDREEALHRELGATAQRLAGEVAQGVEIALVNKLWADARYDFRRAYLKGMSRAYHAPVARLDFRANPEGSRRQINAWAEANTQGRVANLLPPGAINSLTALVIANALHFKGAWADRFPQANTHPADFWVAPGRAVRCSMMVRQGEHNLYLGPSFALLELPYRGQEFSMLVILPHPDHPLAAVERELTPEGLTRALGSMARAEVLVYLPKFRVRAEYELRQPLKEMGMPLAFTDAADFSRMAPAPDLKISNVFHSALVEVSEEGAEAAAATAVVVQRKMARIPHEFIANRPFLFLIRENATGEILFMGRLAHPDGP